MAMLAFKGTVCRAPTSPLLRFFIVCIALFLSGCLPYPDPIPTPTVMPAEARITQGQTRNSYHTLLYQIEADAAREGWTSDRHAEAARLWLSLGDLRRARPHLEAAALSDEPDDLHSVIDMAVQFNQIDDALMYLDRLLTVAPTDRRGLYQSALLLLPFDPLRSQIRLQQLTLDVQFGDSARQILQMMRQTPPDDRWSARVGAFLAQAQLWTYAEWAFVYAGEHLPSAEAWAYAGLMRDAQGGDGQVYLDRAVSMLSANTQVQLALGIHRRHHGDYEGALLALQFALTLDPLNPSLHAELGKTYQEFGDTVQAQKWLQSAYTLSGGDPAYEESLTAFQNLIESGQIAPP